MKTKIALCLILPLVLVACATLNVKMTPKHQLAMGWGYYNTIYDDYVQLRALENPSENEKAVMRAEYDALVYSWPILMEATRALRNGEPISDAVILCILALSEQAKEVRF